MLLRSRFGPLSELNLGSQAYLKKESFPSEGSSEDDITEERLVDIEMIREENDTLEEDQTSNFDIESDSSDEKPDNSLRNRETYENVENSILSLNNQKRS